MAPIHLHPEAGRTVEWPRFHDGTIMWREYEEWEQPVGCPLCGAAVFDTDTHVRWHGPESADGLGGA
jgi:hypothetical protein